MTSNSRVVVIVGPGRARHTVACATGKDIAYDPPLLGSEVRNVRRGSGGGSSLHPLTNDGGS
ncbi:MULTISPECIES: hypothetical protein [Streptomyces]|uniref:Uncharacterized protein n=2 Tax=Streptomyces TaxID=1883 RepID=A0ABV9J0Y7_9ACTN